VTALAAFFVFATARGVYVTPDAGLHVHQVATVGIEAVVDDVAWVDRRHIWYVRWNIPSVRAFLYRSANGGRTWRVTEVPSHGAHADARDSIQFLDARRGWLTVQEPTAPFATLYRTDNGGATWQRVSGLPEVAAVTFQTRTIAWLAGGRYSRYVYRSTDCGKHWRRRHVPRGLYGTPQFAAGHVLLPLLRGRTFRVYDGTRSSPALRVPVRSPANCLPPPLSLVARSRTRWWTAAGRWIYRTTDAGRHWRRSPGPLGAAACDAPSLRAAGALILRVGSRSFASGDGVHWRPLPWS